MSLSDKKSRKSSVERDSLKTSKQNLPTTEEQPTKRSDSGSPQNFSSRRRLIRLSPTRKSESRQLLVDGEELDTSTIKPIPISRSNSPVESFSEGSSPLGIRSGDEELPKKVVRKVDDSSDEGSEKIISVPATRTLAQRKSTTPKKPSSDRASEGINVPSPAKINEHQTESSSELTESETEELLAKPRKATPIKLEPKTSSRKTTPIKAETPKPEPTIQNFRKTTPLKVENQKSDPKTSSHKITPLKAESQKSDPKTSSHKTTPIKVEASKPEPTRAVQGRKTTPIRIEPSKPEVTRIAEPEPTKSDFKRVTPLKAEPAKVLQRTTPIKQETVTHTDTPKPVNRVTPTASTQTDSGTNPVRKSPRKATPIAEEARRVSLDKSPPKVIKTNEVVREPARTAPRAVQVLPQARPKSILRAAIPLAIQDASDPVRPGVRHDRSATPREYIVVAQPLPTESPRGATPLARQAETPVVTESFVQREINYRNPVDPRKRAARQDDSVPSPLSDDPMPINVRDVREIEDDEEEYSSPRLVDRVILEKKRIFSGASPTVTETTSNPVRYFSQEPQPLNYLPVHEAQRRTGEGSEPVPDPAIEASSSFQGRNVEAISHSSGLRNEQQIPTGLVKQARDEPRSANKDFQQAAINVKRDSESIPYAPMLPFTSAEPVASSKLEQIDLKKQQKKLKKAFDKLIDDNKTKKIDPFDPNEPLEDENQRYDELVKEININKAVKKYQIGLAIGAIICDAFEGRTFELKPNFTQKNYNIINTYQTELRELAEANPAGFLDGFSPAIRLAATFLFNFVFALLIKWLIANYIPNDYGPGLESAFWQWRRGNDPDDKSIGPSDSNKIAELLSKVQPILNFIEKFTGFGGAPKEEVAVEADTIFSD